MATMHMIGDDQNTACGQWSAHQFAWTADRVKVTCKRCLASVAKQDREFQRKARGWFRPARHVDAIDESLRADRKDRMQRSAARAIAAEEGR